MLFSGPRGIGKSTFAYHFSNYLLSQNEDNKYSIEENKINQNNKSFNLVCNNSHPNIFILKNDINSTNIKIDSVRNLINFLNKTTYSTNLKISTSSFFSRKLLLFFNFLKFLNISLGKL